MRCFKIKHKCSALTKSKIKCVRDAILDGYCLTHYKIYSCEVKKNEPRVRLWKNKVTK